MAGDVYLHLLPEHVDGVDVVTLYRAWRDVDVCLDEQLRRAAASSADCQAMVAAAARRQERLERQLQPLAQPAHWVGSVSWRDAVVSGDWAAHVPAAVEQVHELYHDAPVLTRGLLAQTMVAFNLPNTSGYRTVRPRELRAWLVGCLGRRVFPVTH